MDFYKEFKELADNKIKLEQMDTQIKVDTIIKIGEINSKFFKFLKFLSPFGPGNLKPKFLTSSVNIKGIPRIIGENNDTLKFTVQDNRSIFDAIGFNMVEKYEYLITGKSVDMIYEISDNEWKENGSIQLEIKDIKLEEQSYA